MKKLLGILFLFVASPSFAGYGSGTINRFYVDLDGWVFFGLQTALPNTCSYFIEQFKFSSSTPAGKSMLAVVVAAKAANAPLVLWYSDSTAPGTNHTNGCTGSTMSVVSGIGMQ